MNISTAIEEFQHSKKIQIGALAVLTAGVLCVTGAAHRQALAAQAIEDERIAAELAAEEAAWAAELARMAEEEAQAARARTLGAFSASADGAAVQTTGYLPLRSGGAEQEADLSGAIAALGQPAAIAEGGTVVLEFAEDVPASVIVWRSPADGSAPAESVNYTREETDGGVRCTFVADYGAFSQLRYQVDVKLDEDNHGVLGFAAAK